MDSVDSLCSQYGVDLAHARQVAGFTRQLLEAARPIARVSTRLLALAETAALLHNIGMTIDAARHHTVGRDIVAAADLDGCDAAERAMIACAVRFHRKAVDADAESLTQALSDDQRREVMLMTAALRVADGLDYEGTQTTRLAEIEIGPEASLLRIRGPFSHEDGARALAKADVWNSLLPPLRVEARMTRPGAGGDMPLEVAARRILRYLADRGGLGELAAGGVPERVKRLRVALRRLRAGVRAFGPYARLKGLRGVAPRLRALARAGGPARETEMMIETLDAFLSEAGEETRAALGPLRQVWERTRQESRRVYADVFARSDAPVWMKRLAGLRLATKDRRLEDAPGGTRLMRHFAPELLERNLARVRACDTLTADSPPAEWHRYRLAVRRLRDVADLLRDALPAAQIDPLLARCAKTQDALGEMRDAHITAQAALLFVSAIPLDGGPGEAERTAHAALDFAAHLQARAAALQPASIERWP